MSKGERERERDLSGEGGGNSKYWKLWDFTMHIHENHLHLSCERKCGRIIKKKTHTHAEVFLLYVQAARCLRSCEKEGCRTWLSAQRVKAKPEKGKRRMFRNDCQVNLDKWILKLNSSWIIGTYMNTFCVTQILISTSLCYTEAFTSLNRSCRWLNEHKTWPGHCHAACGY